MRLSPARSGFESRRGSSNFFFPVASHLKFIRVSIKFFAATVFCLFLGFCCWLWRQKDASSALAFAQTTPCSLLFLNTFSFSFCFSRREREREIMSRLNISLKL